MRLSTPPRLEKGDRKAETPTKRQPRIWIHPYSLAEGISSWRKSLAEVILLAKRLDAILVEPDIQHARAVAPGTGKMRLFDIFNRDDVLDNVYSFWASVEEYRHAMNTSSKVSIIQWEPGRTINPRGGRFFHPPSRREVSEWLEPLERALVESSKSGPSDMIVLNMSSVLMERSIRTGQVSSETVG